jgi:hypothetical protein
MEYPTELTPELREVLSMMVFELSPIAPALRAAGHDIKRRAEDEQAAVLHWLIGIVLEHGKDWRKHAADEIERMAALAGQPITKPAA